MPWDATATEGDTAQYCLNGASRWLDGAVGRIELWGGAVGFDSREQIGHNLTLCEPRNCVYSSIAPCCQERKKQAVRMRAWAARIARRFPGYITSCSGAEVIRGTWG